MRKSNLIYYLRSFTKKELRAFGQYLKDRHAQKKIALNTFNYLKTFHPKYSSDQLIKEYAFKKIFGKTEVYNSRKLVDALSDLHLIVKEFMLMEELKTPSFEKDLLLLAVLKKRKLETKYLEKIEQSRKELEKNKKKDLWDHLKMMLLNHFSYFLPNNKIGLGQKEVHQAMQQLDLFYFGAKLLYSSELYSRKSILKEKVEIVLLEPFIEYYEQKEQQLPLFHQIYLHVLSLIRFQSPDSFQFLKKLLFHEQDSLREQEQKIILTYLLNYTVAIINQGQLESLREGFDLHNLGIKRRLFLENDRISFTRFNNIVDTACKLGEFEWVEDFIGQWSSCLEVHVRKGTIKIAYALIRFEQKQYDRVIEILKDEKLTVIDHVFRTKWLLLCSYFEVFGKSNKSIVLAYSRAFEAYLKRTPAVENTALALGSLNLIRFIRKLIHRSSSKKDLLEEIHAVDFIFFKSWLIYKIENQF